MLLYCLILFILPGKVYTNEAQRKHAAKLRKSFTNKEDKMEEDEPKELREPLLGDSEPIIKGHAESE